MLNSASLNHARMLVVYLLDNPLSEHRSPKDFKDCFSHVFGDVSLLLAAATHPHFRMPAVLRLSTTLTGTVKATLISEMKSLIGANLQSSDSNNEEDNEQDFFKVKFIFKRMRIWLSSFKFILKILLSPTFYLVISLRIEHCQLIAIDESEIH